MIADHGNWFFCWAACLLFIGNSTVASFSEKGKYFIDFKSGAGNVGQGDPGVKPDVTITMNEEVFLKIFNRELQPATAFMTGKVKVSGDLSKALTLEKVMKATREASEANKKGWKNYPYNLCNITRDHQ